MCWTTGWSPIDLRPAGGERLRMPCGATPSYIIASISVRAEGKESIRVSARGRAQSFGPARNIRSSKRHGTTPQTANRFIVHLSYRSKQVSEKSTDYTCVDVRETRPYARLLQFVSMKCGLRNGARALSLTGAPLILVPRGYVRTFPYVLYVTKAPNSTLCAHSVYRQSVLRRFRWPSVGPALVVSLRRYVLIV